MVGEKVVIGDADLGSGAMNLDHHIRFEQSFWEGPPYLVEALNLFPYRPCPRCRRSSGAWYRRAWRCYYCFVRLEPNA